MESSAHTPIYDTAGPARASWIGDLTEIVQDLWNYRDLLYQLTLRDIRIRYKQAVMGFGWAIFLPAVIILSGLVVKYAMAYLSGGSLDAESIASVAVKSLPWAFFLGALGFATNSLVGNKSLVTKIYFPREVLPLSATLAQAFDSSIGTLTLLAVLPFLAMVFSANLLWVPLLALLLFAFTLAVGLFLGCANLFFRDVKYIVRVVLTFGIFFTPVFFEPEMLGPTGARLMLLNPLAPILEGLRLSVVEGHNLAVPILLEGAGQAGVLVWSPWLLVYSAVWAIGGLLFSALFFHRLEFLFAEYA